MSDINYHAFDKEVSPGLTRFDRVTRNNPLYKQYAEQLNVELGILSGDGLEYSDKPCKNCGKKTLVVGTVQRRSADEGMTMVQTCNTCGRTAVIN